MSRADFRTAVLAAVLSPGAVAASTVATGSGILTGRTETGASAFTTALEAGLGPAPAQSGTDIKPEAHTITIQVVLLVVLILLVLRPLPSARVVLRRGRHAALAALARSRTRDTIARSPFDL